MFNHLFRFYSKSSAPTRKIIVGLSPILRAAIKPFIKSISFDGITMYLDTNDNAVFRYLRYKANYEKTCVDALKSVVAQNPDCIFLDVGASYGFYTLALAASDRNRKAISHIYAFEPDGRSITALRESIKASQLGGLVTAEQIIAGDEDGKAKLFFSNRASTSNRTFKSEVGTLDVHSSIELPCTRIDSYLAGVDVSDKFIIMKIDVEGNEARVLKGAAKTLATCKGYALLFEYYPVGMREVGQSRTEFSELISALRPDWAFSEVGHSENSGMHPLEGLSGVLRDMDGYKDEADITGAAVGQANNYLIGRGTLPPLISKI